MTLPIERFKDSYQNWRYNPFTDTDMAVDKVEDGLIIPSGSPFIIQLLEQARYNDPASVAVRCYGVATTVDETSADGQPVLKVAATDGFSEDDTVIINRGGDREEEKVIDTIQGGISLTMTENLEFEHTAVQADVVEKYIAFTHTAGAPAQSQFRVDYPTGDGGKGTGLVEFNTNDANKEVMITYKATGSPALAETLDTKISFPTGAPGDDQIVGFSSGEPIWRDFSHANLIGVSVDQHHAQVHTLASHSTKPHSALTDVTANQHHAQAHSLASHSTKAHGELTGIGVNDHHPQAHTLGSHSTKAHNELTGIGANDHHPQAHSLASHSTKAHSELTGVTANLHHAQVHALTSHSDFGTYLNQALLTTSNIIHNSGIFNGKFSFGSPTEVVIAADAITVTKSFHSVDTWGDAETDELKTINGGVAGMILVIKPESGGRTIVVKDQSLGGNIYLEANLTFSMDTARCRLYLLCDGASWYEINRFNG